MSDNLITAGVINPFQLPLDRVKTEVADLLEIDPEQIEKIQCWDRQIWVKIANTGVQFVSYRGLELWSELGLAAIKACKDRHILDRLGPILRTEVEQYSQQYPFHTVEKWRDAWAEQVNYVQEKEKSLEFYTARKQEALEWQKSWIIVIKSCQTFAALEVMQKEIANQSRLFEDVPEVTQELARVWQEHWFELSQRSPFFGNPHADFWDKKKSDEEGDDPEMDVPF
ncbi:MAG: hypothetical protein ACOC0N_07430 [Chroococcales cyanobacterium]